MKIIESIQSCHQSTKCSWISKDIGLGSRWFSFQFDQFYNANVGKLVQNLYCSVAQSPSSPVNHWQEGKLGEEGGGKGGAGGEWEEEKQGNCTGTLDSICTDGSLEEPRYAKVASTHTHTLCSLLQIRWPTSRREVQAQRQGWEEKNKRSQGFYDGDDDTSMTKLSDMSVYTMQMSKVW